MKRIGGTMRDGLVVPDEPLRLPDGAQVVVEVPGPDWLTRLAGAWKDDPGIDAWLKERQRSRTMTNGPDL